MHDAETFAEAMTRPTMRFVVPKGIEQQDIQSLHRVRERLIKSRMALVNEIRGLLSEYGIVLPKGVSKFRTAFVPTLEAETFKLSVPGQEMFNRLFDEFVKLEAELVYYQAKLEAIAAVRPASSKPAGSRGLHGRRPDKERKRRFHQEPESHMMLSRKRPDIWLHLSRLVLFTHEAS